MKRKLLIADDALIIREILKDLLANSDWEVVGEAADGKQAVELYTELKPDAVTLDMVMPEFDGMYALRRIMASDPGARVLMVSALDQPEIIDRAKKIGARGFIVKPFDSPQVLEALERTMSGTPEHATSSDATLISNN